MKKALFIVIVTFFSCKPSLKVTEKYGGFNGKPKKVEIQKYRMDYSDSIPIEKKAYKIVDFYNSKGVNTKTFMYKSDGSPSTGGVYYTYDKSGNLTRYIMNNIDSTINIEINYKFDKFGNEIEMIWTQGNNKTIKTRTYDRENKIVQIIGKKGDGSFKENAIEKYNDKWNKIELISYDSEGNQKSRNEYGYDKNDNLTSYKRYNANNKLFSFSKTLFNKQNDPIISYSYSLKSQDTILNKTTKLEYLYDENDNIIEEKLFSNEKLSWITRNKYEY